MNTHSKGLLKLTEEVNKDADKFTLRGFMVTSPFMYVDSTRSDSAINFHCKCVNVFVS